MPINFNIKIDFQADWIRYLKMQLQVLGYEVDESWDSWTVSYSYFNWIRRIVSPEPRKVHISSEFFCPPDLKKGLANLQEKIEKGDHIWPHLSRKLKDLKYNDDLLNDWGIHHLHLGITTETDGFVKRTGPVLFARFDNSNAYFINVMDHRSFTKQEMIKILHRNWPDSISQYRLEGVLGLSTPLTDDNIASFRKSGVVSLIEVEKGVVYAPSGMGLTTARTSIDVGRTVDFYIHRMRDFENHVRLNVGNLVRKARQDGHSIGPELRFHLLINEENEVYVTELLSNTMFSLGPLNPKW